MSALRALTKATSKSMKETRSAIKAAQDRRAKRLRRFRLKNDNTLADLALERENAEYENHDKWGRLV
jgi:hypothetical protein